MYGKPGFDARVNVKITNYYTFICKNTCVIQNSVLYL